MNHGCDCICHPEQTHLNVQFLAVFTDAHCNLQIFGRSAIDCEVMAVYGAVVTDK